MPPKEKDPQQMNPNRHFRRADLPDHEMPQLDDNDVWLYQHVLEAFLERLSPGTCGRQKAMLACLCAQARRENA